MRGGARTTTIRSRASGIGEDPVPRRHARRAAIAAIAVALLAPAHILRTCIYFVPAAGTK